MLVRSFQALGIIILYLFVCFSRLTIGTPTIKVDYAVWLDDLVSKGKDSSLNAKPYFDKAAAIVSEGATWPEALLKSRHLWPGDMNAEQREAVAKLLDENAEAFRVLREGVERPYYWTNYGTEQNLLEKQTFDESIVRGITDRLLRRDSFFSMGEFLRDVLKPFAGYKRVAKWLALQITWKAYSGDVAGAFDDYLFLQKFACHLQGKGLLVEQLVGTAIEAIAGGRAFMILERVDVPAGVLKTVQQKLQEQYSKEEAVINFEAEKAFWYDYIQRTFTDDGKGGGRVLKEGLPLAVGDWKGGLGGLVGLAFFNYLDRQELTQRIDRFYQQAELLLRITPWNAGSEAKQEKLDEIAKDSFLLKLLAPALGRANMLAWRMETHRRALLTVLAILRYQKEKSRYPARLDELVGEGYLDKLPMDPYSAGPLVYRRMDAGFLLYSFGTDLKDDGGRLGRGREGKPKMWADEGDWVFWPPSKFQTEQRN